MANIDSHGSDKKVDGGYCEELWRIVDFVK
jgi:hypothetical protein